MPHRQVNFFLRQLSFRLPQLAFRSDCKQGYFKFLTHADDNTLFLLYVFKVLILGWWISLPTLRHFFFQHPSLLSSLAFLSYPSSNDNHLVWTVVCMGYRQRMTSEYPRKRHFALLLGVVVVVWCSCSISNSDYCVIVQSNSIHLYFNCRMEY